MRIDVALVSCMKLPEPDPDAEPLRRALASAEISARLLAWDDASVDWSEARLTVLRSSWNYPARREAFVAWARETAHVSELWNPAPVVCWNSHKSYLVELMRRGVPVVPTALVPRGSLVALRSILDQRGWREVVVKPAVSAASLGTLRVRSADMDAGEAHLRALAAAGDVLVQPYLPSVEDYGERAVVWIDGALTHAVRKERRFTGEEESVSSAPVGIAAAEALLARRALAVVDGPLLYGRVDMAPGSEGKPLLMELELIEPSLFFLQCPAALDRFVAAVRDRLRANNPSGLG